MTFDGAAKSPAWYGPPKEEEEEPELLGRLADRNARVWHRELLVSLQGCRATFKAEHHLRI